MKVALCATCHAQPKEPGSARCCDCGPRRLAPSPHHRLRSQEHAARKTPPTEGNDHD